MALRKSLNDSLGWPLYVYHEKPESVFKRLNASFVVYQTEVCQEERDVENAVSQIQGLETIKYWGAQTLWHYDDLVSKDAQLFTNFQKANQESVKIREMFENPNKDDFSAVGFLQSEE